MKIVFTLFTILLLNGLFAQTFTGGTGPILDNQTIDIPLTVSVPQTAINTTTKINYLRKLTLIQMAN